MGPGTEAIEAAITGRRSVRAFRPDPVPREIVERILDVAARAPSGTNMQPWRAYVLAGSVKEQLSAALLEAHEGDSPDFASAQYRYYPAQFFEPYLGRRRKVGFDLYGLLGIQRGEKDRMAHQHGRNLVFFGAPVGLIFTIDRRLEIGSWLDYGMFLENIAIAARAHGLETCMQAAFAPFHRIIRDHLPLSQAEVVVCGMSIGYEDPDAPENQMRTERVPASEFATFIGWDGGT
ncbi:MAG: nitroreductase [Enterovirga sp.]|nr:nitroreductase [Enterovirga sp.]